jgi:hypothetical protein
MEPYLWWDAVVKARLRSEVCAGCSLWGVLEWGAGVVARGRQPYLGARTVESGDKMIDRVLVPVRLRSLGL